MLHLCWRNGTLEKLFLFPEKAVRVCRKFVLEKHLKQVDKVQCEDTISFIAKITAVSSLLAQAADSDKRRFCRSHGRDMNLTPAWKRACIHLLSTVLIMKLNKVPVSDSSPGQDYEKSDVLDLLKPELFSPQAREPTFSDVPGRDVFSLLQRHHCFFWISFFPLQLLNKKGTRESCLLSYEQKTSQGKFLFLRINEKEQKTRVLRFVPLSIGVHWNTVSVSRNHFWSPCLLLNNKIQIFGE